jgi:hypothetical protein
VLAAGGVWFATRDGEKKPTEEAPSTSVSPARSPAPSVQAAASAAPPVVAAPAPAATTTRALAPAPAPVVAKTPAELYQDAQVLEGSNRRRALAIYEDAAAKGHGPSQKRLWELLRDTPGQELRATRYQNDAWKQGVPGVPEPKKPVTF